MLSSFTLISLVGVMLGVLVLVVVMAVYAGLEREVKDRLLGFTPHILLQERSVPFRDYDGMPDPPRNWRDDAEMARGLPGVAGATPFIADNVIVDFHTWQRPVQFRAIDGQDEAQVAGIDAMLDHANHPGSSADLGIDDAAVVSSHLAEQLNLRVGDVVRLYSTRNFEEVMAAYRATEEPPVREAHADAWLAARATLEEGWITTGDGSHAIPNEAYNAFHSHIDSILAETIRQPERELLEDVLDRLAESENDAEKEISRFSSEQRRDLESAIAKLESTDPAEMDDDILRGLRRFVLPREVEVIGVYQASQLAITPDLFLPIPLSQALAGLDDGVQGIALRLEDPYTAESVRAVIAREIDPDAWGLVTWGEQYQAFFALISQQRVMMYFALSFIVLVSAFSMMAVMFTVTIQKRQEIGVMKALGAAPGQIVRVFLYQGMLLGVLGAILGVGLGRLVIHFRGPVQSMMRAIGFDPFSMQFTGFETLPAHNSPGEQAVIALMAFVLCSLAALVPAFFAARSDAAKSLRNL